MGFSETRESPPGHGWWGPGRCGGGAAAGGGRRRARAAPRPVARPPRALPPRARPPTPPRTSRPPPRFWAPPPSRKTRRLLGGGFHEGLATPRAAGLIAEHLTRPRAAREAARPTGFAHPRHLGWPPGRTPQKWRGGRRGPPGRKGPVEPAREGASDPRLLLLLLLHLARRGGAQGVPDPGREREVAAPVQG